jgi:hypothetical protein
MTVAHAWSLQIVKPQGVLKFLQNNPMQRYVRHRLLWELLIVYLMPSWLATMRLQVFSSRNRNSALEPSRSLDSDGSRAGDVIQCLDASRSS